MTKIILWISLIVISIFSNAYGAVTYSAFTEDGRVLDDFSIIDKNVNFNIIFYSDKKSDFDLLVQTDDNIHKEKILNQKLITMTGSNNRGGKEWLNLGEMNTENLTISLSNSETNIKLNYAAVESNFKIGIHKKNIKYIGEEKLVEFVTYPELKNLQIEDKTVTLRNIKVRGIVHKNICKLESSVVKIKTDKSIGTGFFIEKNKILTNFHVVKDNNLVEVVLKPYGYEKVSFKSPNVGYVEYKDKERDLALIKTQLDNKINISKLTLSDNNTIEKGENVYTIGHPYGSDWSCRDGRITNILKNEYETNISIDKGNSGGPIFNENGKVIGVVTKFLLKNKLMNYSPSLFEVKTFLANYKNIPLKELKNLGQSKKVISKPFDSNGDGFADGTDLDLDNDGIFETRKIKNRTSRDLNGDGIVDWIRVIKKIFLGKLKTTLTYIDANHDGVMDLLYVDKNNDGIPENYQKL
jgi:hypothetical protein